VPDVRGVCGSRLTKVLATPYQLVTKRLLLDGDQTRIMEYAMDMSTNKSANFGGIPERRGTSRFPVREDVRYRVVHSKSNNITGSGTTLNIGSGGILFTTEESLPLGRTVELSVNWPARLDGTCPLQFVATGRVVRSEIDKAAVRIERYEFKTRRGSTVAAGTAAVLSVPGL